MKNNRNKTTMQQTALAHHIDILMTLFHKELKVRYKHLTFGYLWSIGNPLALALVFFFLFKKVMKIQIENYPLFLMAGLFPWQWFTNSVGASTVIFVGNASIIKKVIFPRNILTMAVVMQDALHYLISLPIILVAMLYFHVVPTLNWLWQLPLMFVIQLAYCYGLALFCSTITLFFRDFERMIQILIMFLFYMTPVLFDESMIPQRYQHLIIFHPLAVLIGNWRQLFLHSTLNTSYLLASIAYATLFVIIGQYAYKKLSWRFAEIL